MISSTEVLWGKIDKGSNFDEKIEALSEVRKVVERQFDLLNDSRHDCFFDLQDTNPQKITEADLLAELFSVDCRLKEIGVELN